MSKQPEVKVSTFRRMYRIWKWRYWRNNYPYHWILCKHKNAIERADYGSQWKHNRWTVGRLYGGWISEQTPNKPSEDSNG